MHLNKKRTYDVKHKFQHHHTQKLAHTPSHQEMHDPPRNALEILFIKTNCGQGPHSCFSSTAFSLKRNLAFLWFLRRFFLDFFASSPPHTSWQRLQWENETSLPQFMPPDTSLQQFHVVTPCCHQHVSTASTLHATKTSSQQFHVVTPCCHQHDESTACTPLFRIIEIFNKFHLLNHPN